MKVLTYRGAARRPWANRRTGVAIACAALALASASAQGFGYGQPLVSSALGQVLHLRVPVRLDPDMELSSQCVRLMPGPAGDGIPTLTLARILVERQGERRYLRIDSLFPINEPALRVVVDAGCAQHAQREFLLLLDPPNLAPQLALNPPTVETPGAATAAGAGRGAASESALAPATALDAPAPLALAPATVGSSSATAIADEAERSSAASNGAGLRKPPVTPTVPEQSPVAEVKVARPAGSASAAPKPPAAVAAATNAHPKPEGAHPPPRPGGDRLVLAAANEPPDPAAQRLAQMDQRILELTREVVQLRADLVAERQRQAQAAQAVAPATLPWIIALLSLLGLAVALAVLARQWRRASPWQASAWQAGAAATEPPPAQDQAAPLRVEPEAPREAPRATAAAFSDAARGPVLAGARAQRPRPSVTAAPNFDEPAAMPSTHSPLTDSQQELIEVTEMHADDPSFGALHTVFLDPGALDERPVVRSSGRAAEPGAAAAPPPLQAFADLPPLPAAATDAPAPTVLASDGGLRASLEEAPCTQTPTLLLLDLDLSTQALRVDDPEETAPQPIAAPAPPQRPAPQTKLA